MSWKCTILILVSFSLCGTELPIPQTMLYQADQIAKKYQLELAKAPPPSPLPQTQACLDRASVWFTIDLNRMAASEGKTVLDTLGSEELWDDLKEIGIQAVHLKGLKQGGAHRTGLGIDPRWGTESEWNSLVRIADRRGIALICDSLSSSTGLGTDFLLALKKTGDYPGLYHLIEVPDDDWNLLPRIPTGQTMANVPWLQLQELHKRGYVPEHFTPYTKESRWNATARIQGMDGIVRRWIFLKENQTDPVIDWLDSSYAGLRLASSDALDSILRLGQRIVQLDPKIRGNAKETLSLYIRKLGAFSVQEMEGGIAALKNVSADLAVDSLTQRALLHALIAEDAEALKLIYRLFLEEGISTKRLVHVLQPFDSHGCDWAEFICSPKKKFQYYDEQMTGEALRQRLLSEDAARIGGDLLPSCTWMGYCAGALGVEDYQAHASQIAEAHLLLAFFYAMQPGVFSFSAEDLLGALPQERISLDLMGESIGTLYSCLPNQFKNCRSFALQTKRFVQVRNDQSLESAALSAVPRTINPSVLLLVHKMPDTGYIQILAVNFGKTGAKEPLEMDEFKNATAINLLSGHAEKKPLQSSAFLLELPPLSGKVILFQPKYYD